MSAENKVPAIRFKGFGGEWEEKLLGDTCEETYGGGTPSTSKSEYWNGDIPWIQSSDLVENKVANVESRKRISENGLKNSATKLIPENSIAIVTRVGVGKLALMKNRYATSQDFLSLSKLKIDCLYGVYSIWKKLQSEKLAVQGTSIKGLTKEELLTKKILIPSEKTEQTKIGQYFQQLNTLIAQHQQKHDELLNLKKALLELMFPKQGETVPEIRFKGFSGEWDRRKLLSNFEKIIDFRGRTPKKLGLDWSETGYLALSALNVKNGFIDFNTDANFGDQELYDKWMSGNELHKNQVLFTTEAPMGNVAQIPNDRKYILSQRTIAFEVNPKLIEENFLAVTLRSPSLQRKFTSLSSGGTAQGVSQKSLASVDVVVPKDTTEQTQIGNLFQQLDTLINQHQAQLKKLNNIKQACLEKIFV
ncbi:MAG: restriction endonuclease subunit S [Methylococcales bacterium]|nr:restriction endonuclease subunit S [Methylococcales bacterium]